MVAIGMAENHQIETVHPQRAQRRQYNPLADVEVTISRPCVVQQRMVMRADQHSEPLTDVEQPDFRLPCCRLVDGWKQQR